MTLSHKWETAQCLLPSVVRSSLVKRVQERASPFFVGGQGMGHWSLPYFAARVLLSHTLFLSPATTSTDLFEGPQ